MQHALPESTADLLVVDALGVRGGRLRIVNVYNAPTGGNSLRQGDGIRALSTASLDARQVPTVVAGDFNAFHTDWSTEATSNKRGASGIKLKSWAMAGAWQLGLEVGTVTRRGSAGEQDSAIDLIFKSKALTDSGWEARSSARIDLATGLDHYPVVTVLRPPPATRTPFRAAAFELQANELGALHSSDRRSAGRARRIYARALECEDRNRGAGVFGCVL
ncbi:hypothetical protein A4X06_0g9373 [Tilletia controversa]|uniref:Endonuclease/exonuclease/phosphatase domain-containing protein n=1 Tax=Tilletia controversa TaxID=13291 RepID=A0A8X7MIE0_9BASI|nr:hypothetical protein A4X06_0g9373 [Tilletia controversa]